MADPSASEIADRALDLGLLTESQLQEIWASFGSHNVSREQMLKRLVSRELMTSYQVERLVTGERSGFFFGEYKVLYLVGTGTFARVYRAVHRETDLVVAVKVLRRRFSENAIQAKQFVREGQLGKALGEHPNIVRIDEVYSRGATHFLVMEFVEGWSLRDFVRIRKKVEPAEAVRLVTGIASGLRHAFDKGLTHRDLRPSNVLISSRGEPKLADFGLAAIDEEAGQELGESNTARTVDYAALERITGVRKDDTRSDIYFLGCIFYQMLVGSPPLPKPTDRLQGLSRGRFQDVIPVQDVDETLPHAVTIVVNKAMSLDPNRRYQTPTDMLKDLSIAGRQISEEQGADKDEKDAKNRQKERLAAELEKQKKETSVMVVESNAQMQGIFRKGLKRAGYRVLLTSSPERALERFKADARTADCLILNAQQIGREAMTAFNSFAEDPAIDSIPVVLLVDKSQQHLKEEASTADHRIVLCMPLTMKQLCGALAKLTASEGDPSQ